MTRSYYQTNGKLKTSTTGNKRCDLCHRFIDRGIAYYETDVRDRAHRSCVEQNVIFNSSNPVQPIARLFEPNIPTPTVISNDANETIRRARQLARQYDKPIVVVIESADREDTITITSKEKSVIIAA